eukprot:11157015-Lingulodinium_polyedra.AAC.1
MTRSSRHFVVAMACKLHTRALHVQTNFWSAHGARTCGVRRTAATKKRRFNRVIVQRFANAAFLRGRLDAFMPRCCCAAQFARLHTPCVNA